MSINVTVTGNPVKIKRAGRMVAIDPYRSQQEFEKRRLIRLSQVRQQSKDIAEDIRNKIRQEKIKQMQQIEKEGKQKLRQWHAKKLLDLQNQYHEALRDMGTGHKKAAELDDELEVLKEQKENNKKIAHERAELAKRNRKLEKTVEETKSKQIKQNRSLSKNVEKARATLVAKMKKSKSSMPKKKKKNKILSADINVSGILTESDVSDIDAPMLDVFQNECNNTPLPISSSREARGSVGVSDFEPSKAEQNKNQKKSPSRNNTPVHKENASKSDPAKQDTGSQAFVKVTTQATNIPTDCPNDTHKNATEDDILAPKVPPINTKISDRIRQRNRSQQLDYCDVAPGKSTKPCVCSTNPVTDGQPKRLRSKSVRYYPPDDKIRLDGREEVSDLRPQVPEVPKDDRHLHGRSRTLDHARPSEGSIVTRSDAPKDVHHRYDRPKTSGGSRPRTSDSAKRDATSVKYSDVSREVRHRPKTSESVKTFEGNILRPQTADVPREVDYDRYERPQTSEGGRHEFYSRPGSPPEHGRRPKTSGAEQRSPYAQNLYCGCQYQTVEDKQSSGFSDDWPETPEPRTLKAPSPMDDDSFEDKCEFEEKRPIQRTTDTERLHSAPYSQTVTCFATSSKGASLKTSRGHPEKGSKTDKLQEIPPKPKITLKSAKPTPIQVTSVGIQPSEQASIQTQPETKVDKICCDDLSFSPNLSNNELKMYEQMKQRDREALIRGQKALEKEKIHREYNELLKKLPVLQNQERICELKGDKPEYHMTDERLKELERKKQQKMDQAYERLFPSTRTPAPVTLPVKNPPPKFRTTRYSTIKDGAQMLDLGVWDLGTIPQKLYTAEEVAQMLKKKSDTDFSKMRTDQLREILENLKAQKEELLKEIQKLPVGLDDAKKKSKRSKSSSSASGSDPSEEESSDNDKKKKRRKSKSRKVSTEDDKRKSSIEVGTMRKSSTEDDKVRKSSTEDDKTRKSSTEDKTSITHGTVSVTSTTTKDSGIADQKYGQSITAMRLAVKERNVFDSPLREEIKESKPMKEECKKHPREEHRKQSKDTYRKQGIEEYKKSDDYAKEDKELHKQQGREEYKQQDKEEYKKRAKEDYKPSKEECKKHPKEEGKKSYKEDRHPQDEGKRHTSDEQKLKNRKEKEKVRKRRQEIEPSSSSSDKSMLSSSERKPETARVRKSPRKRAKSASTIARISTSSTLRGIDASTCAKPCMCDDKDKETCEIVIKLKANEPEQIIVNPPDTNKNIRIIRESKTDNKSQGDSRESTNTAESLRQRKSWRDELEKNMSSAQNNNTTTSTSYLSPPEFEKKDLKPPKGSLLGKKPQQVNIDEDTLTTKTDSIPSLKDYIQRLVNMSRGSVENLGISEVSEVTTPNSTIVEMESNTSKVHLKGPPIAKMIPVPDFSYSTEESTLYQDSKHGETDSEKSVPVSHIHIVKKYTQIAERCTERINSLSEMIRKVREEKSKMLSPLTSTEANESITEEKIDEITKKDASTTYLNFPNEDDLSDELLKIDYTLAAKLKQLDEEQLKRLHKEQNGGDDLSQRLRNLRRNEASPRQDDFVHVLSDIPKLPRVVVPNNVPKKPPPSKGLRTLGKSGEPVFLQPHELSTITEKNESPPPQWRSREDSLHKYSDLYLKPIIILPESVEHIEATRRKDVCSPGKVSPNPCEKPCTSKPETPVNMLYQCTGMQPESKILRPKSPIQQELLSKVDYALQKNAFSPKKPTRVRSPKKLESSKSPKKEKKDTSPDKTKKSNRKRSPTFVKRRTISTGEKYGVDSNMILRDSVETFMRKELEKEREMESPKLKPKKDKKGQHREPYYFPEATKSPPPSKPPAMRSPVRTQETGRISPGIRATKSPTSPKATKSPERQAEMTKFEITKQSPETITVYSAAQSHNSNKTPTQAETSSYNNSSQSSNTSNEKFQQLENMLHGIGMSWAIPTLRKTQEALALTSSNSSIDFIKNDEASTRKTETPTNEALGQNRRTSTPIKSWGKGGRHSMGTEGEISSVLDKSSEPSGNKTKQKFYSLGEEPSVE